MRRWTHLHTLATGAAGWSLVDRTAWSYLIVAVCGFALGVGTIVALKLGRRLVYRFDRMLPDAARPALPVVPDDPPKGVQAFRMEQLDEIHRRLSMLTASLPRTRKTTP